MTARIDASGDAGMAPGANQLLLARLCFTCCRRASALSENVARSWRSPAAIVARSASILSNSGFRAENKLNLAIVFKSNCSAAAACC